MKIHIARLLHLASAPLKIVIFMVALIIATLPMPLENAYAQTRANDKLNLDLERVDIHILIDTVSRRTGKNFIVDPRVKATVTLIAPEPVSNDKLYNIFLSILDVHGFAAVQVGSFIKIVPLAVGVESAVPVLRE